jgi:PAS domain-containing protein
MQRTDRYLASLTEEGRYRLLVEAVTDYAIYLLDPSGIVTTWNPGAQRFKGYTAVLSFLDRYLKGATSSPTAKQP